MTDIAMELDHVFKKFKKGEMFDSLRDFVPAMAKRLVRGRPPAGELAGREFWAVQDLSFQIKRAEAFGIIGSNGAGKSTVLKLLTGIMLPTQGAVKVNGKLSALIEVGAGFHPDLTGRENVFLNGTILGMRRDEIARKFDQIVEFAGLAEFIDTPVKRYSSGMFARLGFAVAAHVDPDILIVDEVLSVGDYIFQQKCLDRMNEIIRNGATVVFVSHNLRAVVDLCHRSILIERGRGVAIGPTHEVVQTYLQHSQAVRRDGVERPIALTSVQLRGVNGPAVEVRAGEKAWVDIEVHATVAHEQLEIVLELQDEAQYSLFHSSTQRLGKPAFSLEAGQTFRCTFELDMHLATGTFHFGVYLCRYDIETIYDHWARAATIFVASDTDVRGVAQLYPKVVEFQRQS